MCDIACDYLKTKKVFPSGICGVSYSGIPFAVMISNKLKVPLYLRSKEINLCPEDQRILGNIVPNNEITIIEEVVCSGTSTLQVIKVSFYVLLIFVLPVLSLPFVRSTS